eukprot:7360322-Prymnesium_polylepis.1
MSAPMPLPILPSAAHQISHLKAPVGLAQLRPDDQRDISVLTARLRSRGDHIPAENVPRAPCPAIAAPLRDAPLVERALFLGAVHPARLLHHGRGHECACALESAAADQEYELARGCDGGGGQEAHLRAARLVGRRQAVRPVRRQAAGLPRLVALLRLGHNRVRLRRHRRTGRVVRDVVRHSQGGMVRGLAVHAVARLPAGLHVLAASRRAVPHHAAQGTRQLARGSAAVPLLVVRSVHGDRLVHDRLGRCNLPLCTRPHRAGRLAAVAQPARVRHRRHLLQALLSRFDALRICGDVRPREARRGQPSASARGGRWHEAAAATAAAATAAETTACAARLVTPVDGCLRGALPDPLLPCDHAAGAGRCDNVGARAPRDQGRLAAGPVQPQRAAHAVEYQRAPARLLLAAFRRLLRPPGHELNESASVHTYFSDRISQRGREAEAIGRRPADWPQAAPRGADRTIVSGSGDGGTSYEVGRAHDLDCQDRFDCAHLEILSSSYFKSEYSRIWYLERKRESRTALLPLSLLRGWAIT